MGLLIPFYFYYHFIALAACRMVTEGIMFSTCPSVCACVPAYVRAWAEAFTDRFAVDF